MCLMVKTCDLDLSVEMSRMSLNVKGCVKRKRSVSILPMIPEEVENGAGLRLVWVDSGAPPESCLEPKIAMVSSLIVYLTGTKQRRLNKPKQHIL